MSPFDWLKQITIEKKPWDSFSDEDKDGFNAFIINKALSYNQHYIPIVEMAMTYPMPNDKLYDFYKDAIPKKQVWNKWIKSNVKWDEEEIKTLANYFECGTKDVKDFYSLLDIESKSIILNEINGFEGKPKKKGRKSVPK